MVIVGGGPAGAAAAISCAQRGLKVTLLEAKVFPRARPGETLHPGITPLLHQLGVEEKVNAAAEIRHMGNLVKWGKRQSFVPYGMDEKGPWRGFQILRHVFDSILLQEASSLGAKVLQPCLATAALMEGSRVVGVRSDAGDLSAQWVINCSGANSSLSRSLGQAHRHYSPRMFAYYGYCRGISQEHPDYPVLEGDREGWTWTARVGRELYNWTRLDFSGKRKCTTRPDALASIESLGKTRAAEVTWRCSSYPAGPGYFLAGDAAAVLDPASSQGVLRAIMSGIMAAYLVWSTATETIEESQAIEAYRNWIHKWFLSDLKSLRSLYLELEPRATWLMEPLTQR